MMPWASSWQIMYCVSSGVVSSGVVPLSSSELRPRTPLISAPMGSRKVSLMVWPTNAVETMAAMATVARKLVILRSKRVAMRR